MNECLHNYEMSAIGMKKRERKKRNEKEGENEREREKETKRRRKFFFSSLALRSIVQGENKREREDLNQPPSFLYQCGNRNEGVSSIILPT